MDAAPFLGLEPTADPRRFRLPVTQDNCVGSGFLFGGAALGTAIEALEAATARPLIWGTCQYLSYARPPSTLDLAVTIAASGRQTTQARCTGTVGDTEIFTVNAALGTRDMPEEGEWAVMPEVPPPSAAEERQLHHDQESSVMRHIENWVLLDIRVHAVASGFGHGLVHLWAEDGTLLGTASQSTIVRFWQDDA